MQEIIIITVAVTYINLWLFHSPDFLMKRDGIQIRYKNKFCEFIGDKRPFNCGDCLSLWIGIILFILLDFNIILLSLPLFYRITFKLWN
jgi:hypothetical protein